MLQLSFIALFYFNVQWYLQTRGPFFKGVTSGILTFSRRNCAEFFALNEMFLYQYHVSRDFIKREQSVIRCSRFFQDVREEL